MKNLRLSAVLFAVFVAILAAKAEILSIDKILNETGEKVLDDASKVEFFDQHYSKAKSLIKADLEGALNEAFKAKDLAFELKATEKIGKAHWMVGYIYESGQNFRPAIDYYHAAFRAYREINDDKKCEILLANVAKICLDNGAYEEAAKFYQQRLEYTEQLGFVTHARGQYDLALPLKFSNRVDEAITALIEAKKLLEQDYKLKDTTLMADVYNELGIVYREMAILAEKNAFLDSARRHYRKAGKINRSLLFQAKIHNNIAESYLIDNNPDTALTFLEHAIELKEKIGSDKFILSTLNNIGIAYFKKGEYDLAYDYLKQSMDLQLRGVSELNDFEVENNIQLNTIPYFDLAREYLDMLVSVDPNQYNYPSASIFQKMDRMSVNLVKIKSAMTLIVVRAAQQVLEKERERKLNQDMLFQWFWVGGIITVLLFVGLYLLYLNKQHRVKLNKFEVHNKKLFKIIMGFEMPDNL